MLGVRRMYCPQLLPGSYILIRPSTTSLRDFASTPTEICINTTKTSKGRQSNDDASPSFTGICSSWPDDTHGFRGPSLRMLALGAGVSQAATSLMAPDTCECRTHSSYYPSSAVFALVDADWSRPCTSRSLHRMAEPNTCHCARLSSGNLTTRSTSTGTRSRGNTCSPAARSSSRIQTRLLTRSVIFKFPRARIGSRLHSEKK